MNKLSLVRFLVKKYLVGTASHTTLRVMGYITIISIAVTTFTLALQIFIAQGFEQALAEKMQNIYPDLLLTAHPDESFNFKNMQQTLMTDYPDILSCAPGHSKHALIKTDLPFSQTVISIKAIDPILEPLVSNLETKLQKNSSLKKALCQNSIIVGKVLAETSKIRVGDIVTLMVYDEDTDHELAESDFTCVSLPVGGIIETGIHHYDAALAICSLETMNEKLLDPTISIMSLKVRNQKNVPILLEKLSKNYSCTIDCWQTLYPALVAASHLEKYVGMLLLALMSLVACSTITGFIFMQIILKKKDIALLMIMGFSQSSIATVFIVMGMILTGSAAFLGLTAALLAGLFLQKYKWITLPEVYDVTHIPVMITPLSVLFVLCLVLLLGLLATLLATYQIKTLNPSHTLRFDE